MTFRNSILVSALLCFAAAPTLATDVVKTEKSGVQSELQMQREQQRTLVHKMMGHINLAALSLDMQLPDAARDHLDRAASLVSQLEAMAPEFTSDSQLTYGKLSYDLVDEVRDYYIPIVDDIFLLSDYEPTFHAWRDRVDVAEVDAGTVLVTVRADLREIDKALGEARTKLDAKEYGAAAEALSRIYRGSIVDEVAITDPLWAVHDNLALAQNLIREERYDSARFALEHARSELGKLKKEQPAETERIQKLDASVVKVEGELAQKDPSFTQRAKASVASMMTTVRSWF
jgi:hypothetical protein